MFDIKIFILHTLLWITSTYTTHASVIPAAIIRKHTVTYKDVPMYNKPVQPQMILVPASIANLYVHFRTKSSQVHVRQVHQGAQGHTQHSLSQDEPHYLKHEIKKPVIQTVREVIVPYRQVIQEIKPVVEEVKTLVSAKGTGYQGSGYSNTGYTAAAAPVGEGPKSSVYMNFGDNNKPLNNDYVNSVYNSNDNQNQNSYGYVLTASHPPVHQPTTSAYSSGPTGNSYSTGTYYSYSTGTGSQPDSKKYSYDLSSIYGINPSNDELSGYVKQPVYELPVPDTYKATVPVQEQPIIYGLAAPLDHSSGYSVNTIHSKPEEYSVNKPQEYSVSKQQEYSVGHDNTGAYGGQGGAYDEQGGAYSGQPGDDKQSGYGIQYTTQDNSLRHTSPVYNHDPYHLADAYYENPGYSYTPNSQQHYYIKNNDGYYGSTGAYMQNIQNTQHQQQQQHTSAYDSGAHYVTLDLVNTAYHTNHGYADDLATSDGYGQALDVNVDQGNAAPGGYGQAQSGYDQYGQDQLTKATTLGSLAQFVNALQPYQYSYATHTQQPLQTYRDA